MNFNSIRNIIITTNWLNRKGFNAVDYRIATYKKEYKPELYRLNVDDTILIKSVNQRKDIFILDSF